MEFFLCLFVVFVFLTYHFVALKRAVSSALRPADGRTPTDDAPRLGTLASDTPGQLNVLRHDGHTLCVDGAQVGVLEESHEVGLAGLLQRHDSRALETEIGLEVLCNLSYETLEGELAN